MKKLLLAGVFDVLTINKQEFIASSLKPKPACINIPYLPLTKYVHSQY